MKKELDKETKKVLSDGEQINDLISSRGWSIAKKKLLQKVAILDSISSVPQDIQNPMNRLRELEIREGVVSVILEWLRDVEGTAQQFKSNAEILQVEKEDSLVNYYK